MSKLNLNNYNRVYFCGILGVSMSSLAKHSAIQLGKAVSGSDSAIKGKVSLFDGVIGYSGKNLNAIKSFNPDLVVYTSALDMSNKELRYAKKNGIAICKRSEFLGAICGQYKTSVAISGCHGKTTVTSMVARILRSANKNFTSFIGGVDNQLGNYYYSGEDIVILEACEFKKNFLDIKANISVVLNIDNDHADSFLDMNDRIETFKKFASNGVSIINADDKYCSSLIGITTLTYGINKTSKYSARSVKLNSFGGYTFDFYIGDVKKGKIELKILGKHNIYNALCACAVADSLNIPFIKTKSALENFENVKRRMEYVGKLYDKDVFCDYAHHPTEINSFINGIACKSSQNLFVFQPHTYSRTRELMSEFTKVLSQVNNLIIYKTFPSREKFDKKGSAKSLYKEIKNEKNNNVKYASSPRRLKKELCKNSFYGKIYVLGAGDVYNIIKKLC